MVHDVAKSIGGMCWTIGWGSRGGLYSWSKFLLYELKAGFVVVAVVGFVGFDCFFKFLGDKPLEEDEFHVRANDVSMFACLADILQVRVAFAEREEVADKSATFELHDGGIAVVVGAVVECLGLAPCAAFVAGRADADASAFGELFVGQRDVSVTGVEDRHQPAVAQSADVGEGLIAPRAGVGADVNVRFRRNLEFARRLVGRAEIGRAHV